MVIQPRSVLLITRIPCKHAPTVTRKGQLASIMMLHLFRYTHSSMFIHQPRRAVIHFHSPVSTSFSTLSHHEINILHLPKTVPLWFPHYSNFSSDILEGSSRTHHGRLLLRYQLKLMSSLHSCCQEPIKGLHQGPRHFLFVN